MQNVAAENEIIRRKVLDTLGIKKLRKHPGMPKAGGQDYLTGKGMLEFDQLIREGFPVIPGAYLKNTLKLTYLEFAKMLGISPKTLQRKRKAHERLSIVESDRLFRIVRIFAVASQVLEDDKVASEWMHRPQQGLGGRVPLEMIQTEAGAREVEDLLGRIEHGVLS
jgi:putative toxin-antitoxin system antitoxin component (TIGR02293 family)